MLLSCSSEASRNKKMKAAITADLVLLVDEINKEETNAAEKIYLPVDSISILSIEPITTSRHLELHIANKERSLSAVKKNLELDRSSLQFNKETLQWYAKMPEYLIDDERRKAIRFLKNW